jgi:type I restriction enzyme S subunit
MSDVFADFTVDALTATQKGAMKIGPFGSQLRKEEMVAHGVKVYGQENVISSDWAVGERRISPSKFRALSSCELESGDIVVSMMGTAGKCAVFPPDAERGIMDSHLLRIQPNLALVERDYLAIALQAENVVGRQVTAMSHGSIMAGLSSKIVKRFKIPLPPLGEQPKIVEVLRVLDTAIHETEAIIAKLRAVKQGLLHDLLTRGIDANGELRPPQAEAPHLYKQSSLGWIPREWEDTELGVVTTWASGGTPSRAVASNWVGPIPLLTPKDMKSFEMGDTSEHISLKAAQLGSRVMSPETVFIVVRGMILAHSFPVVLGSQSMAFNQDVKAVTAGPRLSGRFLAHWFVANSSRFLRKVTEATHGTKKLDLAELVGMPIGLPALAEQQAIIERQAALDRQFAEESHYVLQLRDLKAGLMDDLLTGRVRVTPLLAEAEPQEQSA